MSMVKWFKLVCLVGLVLFAIILPATAAQFPDVIRSGVSRMDDGTNQLLEEKYVWTTTDSAKQLAVWMEIPQGADVEWNKAGCTNSLQTGCSGTVQYYAQWRFFTPEGKDWLKDYKTDYYRGLYDTDNGKIYLAHGVFFRGADGTANANAGDEYGGPHYRVSDLISTDYEWRGRWTAELYILDANANPRKSTLVATEYFTLTDDSVLTTTPTTVLTTVPITQSPNQKIILEGEKYIDANVQKTGAEWDSSEEKCPTWRGYDWSGTGDYYLSHGGDTLTYLFNVPVAGTYVMWMRDWSDTNHATGDRQVSVTIDGATIGTFDAASSFNKGITGYGWDKLTTIDLGAGSHSLKITKKETTSSAAIIDELWFSSNVDEIPQGYNSHSEALCPVTSVTTTFTPMIYCTAPPCSSGKFVCRLENGCPGGCGMSCDTTTPPTPVPPTPSGIETAVILIAIGLGIIVVAKRKD